MRQLPINCTRYWSARAMVSLSVLFYGVESRSGGPSVAVRTASLLGRTNKRLEWARKNLHEAANGFQDVIFTDEASIQLETHRRFCCHKIGERPKNKPRYIMYMYMVYAYVHVCLYGNYYYVLLCRAKHPTKVHVWAGISVKGRTGICIFDGIMEAPLYIQILDETLLPFIRDVFPDGFCRFMQDNDPKHTSRLAQQFFDSMGIYWWKTPAESPDCNPIENIWHELKEYQRREVKPHTKQELVDGILKFWETVDIAKCKRYIRHLKKVLPRVIELNGDATGY